LIDRELYLPKAWTSDPARCQGAGVPTGRPFATKPQLARQLLARTFAAGVPVAWVTGDSVYGDDRRLRMWLESQVHAYVLAVSGKEYVWLGWQQRQVKRSWPPCRFFGLPGNLAGHCLQGLFASLIDHLAVELQVSHIRPVAALNVGEHLGTGEVAVKRAVSRHPPLDGIVDQLDTQLGVVLELALLTRVFFPEPAPVNGIVRSRGTDVVGDQVIMGDDVTLVGMVPEPADVGDQFARMVNQGSVDGNHTARAVARLGSPLQPPRRRSLSAVTSQDTSVSHRCKQD
jgi:hypothetical protein